MADLFDRLFPESPDADSIAVHYLTAALVDYAAGETTRTQIINWWDLDSDAQTDLNVLCDQLDAITGKAGKMAWGTEFHAILMFAEAGAKYTTQSSFKTRLGL